MIEGVAPLVLVTSAAAKEWPMRRAFLANSALTSGFAQIFCFVFSDTVRK